jgi:tRNA U34 5-methylaminomethyl-2-thiouridine-forming methyltransferase MnmC
VCYHSRDGADFEAKRLYIASSGIAQALESGRQLVVLDVGLGLGFNAVATIEAWIDGQTSGPLKIVSLEIDTDLIEALMTTQAPWQKDWPPSWLGWCHRLSRAEDEQLGGLLRASFEHPQTGQPCEWTVIPGDALKTAPIWMQHSYDFIWQDAFSPATCPELWTSAWFALISRAAGPQAVLMTYSAARKVRDELTAQGWTPERFASGGTKRHWLKATRAPPGATSEAANAGR